MKKTILILLFLVFPPTFCSANLLTNLREIVDEKPGVVTMLGRLMIGTASASTFYDSTFYDFNSGGIDNPTDGPVLFFSDLIDGPNTGGENNKGVYVTVWGKNFGSSQGSSTITVGGGLVDNYPTWGSGNGYNTQLDMACFQLGANAATGNIVMTTSQGTSNSLPFVVRAGNIYFIDDDAGVGGAGTFADPWDSPQDPYDNAAAGDTFYFRESIWTDAQYGRQNRTNVLYCLSNMASGEVNNGVALVAYPNETVSFIADSDDGDIYVIYQPQTYYVLSKLTLDGNQSIVNFAGYLRLIGNDCQLTDGGISANIGSNGDNFSCLGNYIHGSRYGNSQYHPIYLGDRGVFVEDFEIAWNYLYDNRNTGYNIKLVIDTPGCSYTGSIHDNLMVATANTQRGIIWGPANGELLTLDVAPGGDGWTDDDTITGATSGETCVIVDVLTTKTYWISNRSGAFTLGEVLSDGADTADQGAAHPVTSGFGESSLDFYNNIMVSYGQDTAFGAFRATSGGDYYANTLNIFNNVFYNCEGESVFWMDINDAVSTVTVRNNIMYGTGYTDGYFKAEYISNVDVISDNCYLGSGNGPVEDSDPVNADPTFTDAANNDFTLIVGSPCIDVGFDTTATVASDFNGVTRPQNGTVDIGAHEQ